MFRILVVLLLSGPAAAAAVVETDVDALVTGAPSVSALELGRRRLQPGTYYCYDGKEGFAYCGCPCDQCIYCAGYNAGKSETVCREDLPCGFGDTVNVCCADDDFRGDAGADSKICLRSTDTVVYPDPPSCEDSDSWYYKTSDGETLGCINIVRWTTDKTEKNCLGRWGWIGSEDSEKIRADVACPNSCNTCVKARDAYCAEAGYDVGPPDFTENWAYWARFNDRSEHVYGCSEVEELPLSRCKWVGVGGVKASDVCDCDSGLEGWIFTVDATHVQIEKEGYEGECDGRGSLRNIQVHKYTGDTWDEYNEECQGLLAFDLKQYMGRAVDEARLLLYSQDSEDKDVDVEINAYRMAEPWDKKTTWKSLGGGVEKAERSSKASFTLKKVGKVYPNGYKEFDVTDDVAAWLSGVDNYGWGLVTDGSKILDSRQYSGWMFRGPEGNWGDILNDRPVLYMKLKDTAPTPPSEESASVKLKRDKCKSGEGDLPKSEWTYDAGSNGEQGCKHVSDKAANRCARIGTGGLPAKDACCETCADYDKCDFDEKKGGGCEFTGSSGKTSSGGGGTCADGSTGDLSGYYYKGYKGCSKVAKEGLCGKKGKDKNGKKVRGSDVCCKSCADDAKTSSGGGGTCADGSTGDLSGYYYKATKGCKKVAKEGLCGKKGKDKNGKKVRGYDVCCKSCSGDAKTSSGGGGGGTCADGSKKDLKDYYYKSLKGCKKVAKAGLCGKKGRDQSGKKVRGTDVCCKSC